MILCIDSNIVIWGIKKNATKGQENLIEQAEAFFKWVDENEHDVIIPTVVMSEILASEPVGIRASYMEIISKSFIIVDFDQRASFKYAEILYGRFEDLKVLGDNSNVVRQRMKIDHLIIATAIVNNASCIYSYDKGLAAFAEGYIDVRKFPAPSAKQPDLFSDLPRSKMLDDFSPPIKPDDDGHHPLLII